MQSPKSFKSKIVQFLQRRIVLYLCSKMQKFTKIDQAVCIDSTKHSNWSLDTLTVGIIHLVRRSYDIVFVLSVFIGNDYDFI